MEENDGSVLDLTLPGHTEQRMGGSVPFLRVT